jgi:Aldehyde dehydrogenase family
MNANAFVKSQRDNFNSNTTKPIAFRIGQLKLFLSTLKKNETLLCEAIHADYRKSAFDSFMLEFPRDSDLDIPVKRLIWAKFINAGQTCIAPDYVLMHSSLEKAFLEKAKAEIIAADYSVWKGNYVQIINERNTSRILGLIDNNKVYFGGESNLESRHIAPTLMSNVTFEDRIMSEEIFGPVLPVISYTELDSVIAAIKERPKPLSLYLFTKDNQTKEKIFREISFGGDASMMRSCTFPTTVFRSGVSEKAAWALSRRGWLHDFLSL